MQEIGSKMFFKSSRPCLSTCLWCYNWSDLHFKAHTQHTRARTNATTHTHTQPGPLEFTRRQYQLNESLTYLFHLFQIKFTVRQHFWMTIGVGGGVGGCGAGWRPFHMLNKCDLQAVLRKHCIKHIKGRSDCSSIRHYKGSGLLMCRKRADLHDTAVVKNWTLLVFCTDTSWWHATLLVCTVNVNPQRKNLNALRYLCIYRCSWLPAEFQHDFAWSARAQKGGGVCRANKKTAPSPALYNSVLQALSDATTKFLQLGESRRIIGCAFRRAHTLVLLLRFCFALSTRTESTSGFFFRLLWRADFNMSAGQTYEKKIACILTDLPGSMSCHPNSKDSPTLPESSVTDMGYYSGQTAHGQHEYYQSQPYGQPMNSYHHQFNLNGMGAAGAYATKSEYPYTNGYRQFGHYNRDHLQASPPSSGKCWFEIITGKVCSDCVDVQRACLHGISSRQQSSDCLWKHSPLCTKSYSYRLYGCFFLTEYLHVTYVYCRSRKQKMLTYVKIGPRPSVPSCPH